MWSDPAGEMTTEQQSRAEVLPELADALEGRSEELVEAMLRRIRTDLDAPRGVDREDLRAASRRSCTAMLAATLAAVRGGGDAPAAAPVESLRTTRVIARAGMSLTDYTHAFRIGHAVLWEAFLGELESHDELDAAVRNELLRSVSDLLFRYVDGIAEIVSEEYLNERDRVMRTREHQLARLVREILAGGGAATEELGYDLGVHHVGAVAWGDDAEPHLEKLAARLDQPLLCVPVSDDLVWGWFGNAEPPDAAQWRTLVRTEPPAGTSVAIGLPEPGREGFARTHRQASDARRVVLEAAPPVTTYSEVALEAVAGRDEDAAREFLERELRPLLGEDERHRRLRETLRAYFAAAQNASAAAAMLGVHEQTVAYRLRAIEKLLGCPATMRRAELETALRLLRFLPNR